MNFDGAGSPFVIGDPPVATLPIGFRFFFLQVDRSETLNAPAFPWPNTKYLLFLSSFARRSISNAVRKRKRKENDEKTREAVLEQTLDLKVSAGGMPQNFRTQARSFPTRSFYM